MDQARQSAKWSTSCASNSEPSLVLAAVMRLLEVDALVYGGNNLLFGNCPNGTLAQPTPAQGAVCRFQLDPPGSLTCLTFRVRRASAQTSAQTAR